MSVPTPEYREYRPHPDVAPFVACYWTLRADAPPTWCRDDRVLPDGCMDLLFDATSGEDALAVGTMTRALPVSYRGSVDLVGVRFRPGAAPAFLGVPAHLLTDRVERVDDATEGRCAEVRLWREKVAVTAEELAGTGRPEERVRVLDTLLGRRLVQAADSVDRQVLAAATLAERSGGRLRIPELAEAAELSHRQLERRFRTAVGVTPKTACRVIRLQRAVALLNDPTVVELSRIALRSGYADQSHLTREFRAMAGVTPAAYRRSRKRG